MKTLLQIRDADVALKSKEVSVWKERKAARCILQREDKIALLHVQKYSYHKLPGGGIEDKETTEEALHREVAEEVGSVIRVGKLLGNVIEYRSRTKTRQTSICFHATEIKKGIPNYTSKERKDGFRLAWYPLKEAIKLLDQENHAYWEGKFIVKRDLRFLREAEK